MGESQFLKNLRNKRAIEARPDLGIDVTRFSNDFSNSGNAFAGIEGLTPNPALANQGTSIYNTNMAVQPASAVLTPSQSAFANKYSLTPQQMQSVNSDAIAVDGQELGLGGQVSDFFGGTQGVTDALGFTSQASRDSKAIMADPNLSEVQRNDKMKALQMGNEIDQANSFDYTGAFNTGLSAFNAYNQYNYQNDMMDMYKKDLGMKHADQNRRDATRKSWGSAFANAGK